MDIEGVVTASSTNWLMINGNRKVTLTTSTHYKGLAGAAAITTGMYLEIEDRNEGGSGLVGAIQESRVETGSLWGD